MAFLSAFALERRLIHLGALALALACSNQGEGERCDARNRSSDCESGLVCTPASDLVGVEDAKGAALCCPPEGQAASTEGCQRGGIDIPTDDGGALSGGSGGGGTGASGGTAASGGTGAVGGTAGAGGAGGSAGAMGGSPAAGAGGALDAGSSDGGS